MPRIAIEQPSETDIDAIHAVLRETYWSPGIPRETVARACANSMCAVARDDKGKLIVSRARHRQSHLAWLCDDRAAGRGGLAARWCAPSDHPGCVAAGCSARRTHGVYAPLGATPLDAPERFMQIRNPKPYGRAVRERGRTDHGKPIRGGAPRGISPRRRPTSSGASCRSIGSCFRGR